MIPLIPCGQGLNRCFSLSGTWGFPGAPRSVLGAPQGPQESVRHTQGVPKRQERRGCSSCYRWACCLMPCFLLGVQRTPMGRQLASRVFWIGFLVPGLLRVFLLLLLLAAVATQPPCVAAAVPPVPSQRHLRRRRPLASVSSGVPFPSLLSFFPCWRVP